MYEERIREIEHGSFTPLHGFLMFWRYVTLYWLKCKLSFSLLRSAITCLRGSRSSYHRFKFSDSAIDLACAESHLDCNDDNDDH